MPLVGTILSIMNMDGQQMARKRPALIRTIKNGIDGG